MCKGAGPGCHPGMSQPWSPGPSASGQLSLQGHRALPHLQRGDRRQVRAAHEKEQVRRTEDGEVKVKVGEGAQPMWSGWEWWGLVGKAERGGEVRRGRRRPGAS